MCLLVPKEKPISTEAKLDSLGLPFESKEHELLQSFFEIISFYVTLADTSLCVLFLHPPKEREI